jgi:hypothetical protein
VRVVAEDRSKMFGYVPELPDDVRPIYQNLCGDLVSLHSKWHLYLDLFSDAETIELLNDAGPATFQMIEESLRSDIIMSIGRLHDPAESGKDRENLSFAVLVKHLPADQVLSQLLGDFKTSCKPIEKHRNKRVAHNDLSVALQPHDSPLPGINRGIINAVLAAAVKLMEHVYHSYADGGLSFEPDQLGDGKSFVGVLRRFKDLDRQDG